MNEEIHNSKNISMLVVEKPRISDVSQIHQLINHFAANNEMLPRPLSDLYENVREGLIVKKDRVVIGCVFLHVYWLDLAEIRSLAVVENNQHKGIGSELVRSCVKEAEQLGITTVFCLTYKPTFFEKLGFNRIDRMELPKKVWTDCYRCPKFPNCDEVSLMKHLDTLKKKQ